MTSDISDRGGPPKEMAIGAPEGKPAVITCLDCGAENIQGTDYCANCNNDLRTLDIPPDTWSPTQGPPGEGVGRLASRETVQVPPAMPVQDVIALLRDGDHGCAVVVEDGRVVGVFTERDVLHKITPRREQAMDLPVAEVMTPDPVLLREDDSVLVAINKMGIGGFRHIPLVNEGRALRGILSGRDILEYVDSLVQSVE